MGGQRRPDGRRDGARVGQRHLHERRGLQSRSREAQGVPAGAFNGGATATVKTAKTAITTRNAKAAKLAKNIFLFALLALFAFLDTSRLVVFGQQPPLPLGPNRNAGEAVTGAFEGWFYRADGSISLLLGYFNRNLEQVVDIPVGPNNRIEPGGPDYGQPTHFLPRRRWGVFTIPRPKDFGDTKRSWTIVANGQTTTIPLSLHPNYQVEPYEEKGMGNTPPMLRFEPGGAVQTGPPTGVAATWSATVGEPLPLIVWVTDK